MKFFSLYNVKLQINQKGQIYGMRRGAYKLHSQQRSRFRFFSVLPVLYTQDTFAPFFELQGRQFCSSLLVSFFRCCNERNSIHTASLSHFISRPFGSSPVLFLSSCVRLLNSRKRQHATRGLFERWIPVGSSEIAMCEFCLLVSLHLFRSFFFPLPFSFFKDYNKNGRSHYPFFL